MSAITLTSPKETGPGQDSFRADRLRVLFNGLPVTFAMNIAGGLLFLALFWTEDLQRQLLIWFGLLLATIACRVVLFINYKQHPPTSHNHLVWLSLFLAGTFASATVWGGMIFISPHYGHGLDNLIKTLLLCGLLAGAMISLSIWKWAFMTFMLPVTLPVIYVLLSGQSQLELLIALGLCLLVFFLCLTVEKSDAAFTRNLYLQARNTELILSLQMEEEKVRKDLVSSEEKYSRVFQSSPMPMAISSIADAIIVDVNMSFVEVSGYQREELIGHSAIDLKLWADETERNNFFSKLKNEGRVRNMEVKARVRAGNILQCLITGECINIDGRPHLLAMLRNITHERQMSEQLRLSEEKFSKAFKSLPDPLTLSRLNDGVLVEVNDSCLTVSGYTREELIGKQALDIGVWANPAQRETVTRKLAARGSVRNEPADLVKKNGEIIHCLLSIEIINIFGIPHMLTLSRDITLQIRAQSELLASEAKFRQLVENMREGLCIIDTQGRITYLNDRVCDMLKVSREQSVGHLVSEFVDAENLKIVQKRLTDRAAGRYEPYELTLTAQDGTKVLTQCTPSPIFDVDNTFVGSFAIVSDITRRRETEEALRLSEQRFRYAFKHAPIGIALVNREGIIVQCNPMCHNILGYSEDRLIGKSIQEITHPDDIEQSIDSFRKLMSGECNNYQIMKRYRHKDGKFLLTRLSASAIPGPDGKVLFGIYHVEPQGWEE